MPEKIKIKCANPDCDDKWYIDDLCPNCKRCFYCCKHENFNDKTLN